MNSSASNTSNTTLNGTKNASASIPTIIQKSLRIVYEPVPMEKLNWLIHLKHVQSEIRMCKELIRSEIVHSGGLNEFLHFKQGTILREEGKMSEALDSFQVCLKLNPKNVENFKKVGACLYDLRRYRIALDAYKEAERISCETPDWEVYHHLAELTVILGDVENGKGNIEKAIEYGKNEKSYSFLVDLLKKEGDFKSALSTCKSAIQSCPDCVEMMCEAGFLHLRLGETQRAFENFSNALSSNRACSKAMLGIGCITQNHEEIDVALTKYKTAIQHEPSSVALWNNIGICFHTKQKHVASISCLKRALWMSPLNWRVLYNLGLVHLSINQPASAFNFLCAAVNLRPDVAQSFSTLAISLAELQDAENSLKAFDQAIRLAPNELIHRLNASLVSFRTFDDVKAESYLKQAENLMKNMDHAPKKCVEMYEEMMEMLRVRNEKNHSTRTASETGAETAKASVDGVYRDENVINVGDDDDDENVV